MTRLSLPSAALAILAGTLLLSACGGGGGPSGFAGGSSLSVTQDIKLLRFSWPANANAEFFRLLENPDGISGFSQTGPDLLINRFDHDIAVHLLSWGSASYLLQTCSGGTCTNSLPVTVTNSLASIGYLKASNTGAGDQFGHAVALSGDGNVAAIGAPAEDGTDDVIPDSGAVYLYTRVNGSWQLVQTIKATSPGVEDNFGHAVALSSDGSTLAVGAPREGEVSETGAVYIFGRDINGNWQQQTILRANDGAAGDRFGHALALSNSGNTLVVGAPDNDSTQADSGAVYPFTRSNDIWSPQGPLKAGTVVAAAGFGQAIALSDDGTVLAAGAWREDEGVNTEQGAVYVFTFTDTWGTPVRLSASDPQTGARFGVSVALSGDGTTLAAGAYRADNGTDPDSGAAYIFTDLPGWTLQQRIQPDAAFVASGDQFGISLALGGSGGNLLAVGANLEDGAASGVSNVPSTGFASNAGAAYLFRRDTLTSLWGQHAYLKASNTGTDDQFGFSMAMSGDGQTLTIGARNESGAATGVGGAQSDDSANLAGAAYLY